MVHCHILRKGYSEVVPYRPQVYQHYYSNKLVDGTIDDSLDKIASEVSECRLCRLFRTRTKAVPGEGSSHIKVVLIGEAPGRREDEVGRPFVGAAGKILDNVLEEAGISRTQIFITNIVKCRPPGNRIPAEDEKIACKMYLERQISLLKPNLIGVLGRTAYSSLVGGDGFRANRGRVLKKNGVKYLTTIHPAAVIYNRSLLEILKTDIGTLSNEIERTERRSDHP
jgi:uracil-DNA glycosylase